MHRGVGEVARLGAQVRFLAVAPRMVQLLNVERAIEDAAFRAIELE